MSKIMSDRTFNGKKYKYWKSVDSKTKATDHADNKTDKGYSVRTIKIHHRQFDLYIRKA